MAKKVFLIEDDIFIRDMYAKILTQRGYEVESVTDGQEALKKLQNRPEYDLILLDIMLPKVNGIDVLKEIKKEGPPAKQIPVYLLTNLGQESIIEEATAIGAEGYFIKSAFLPAQIADEVDKLFATPSAS